MSLYWLDQDKLRAARARAKDPEKTTKAKLAESLAWCIKELEKLSHQLDQIGPEARNAERRADDRIELMKRALQEVKGIVGELLEAAAHTHVQALEKIDEAVRGG